jgi:hypothetical protein
MPAKRKISAAEFVEDLRSGMTLSELMDKYSVVPRELDAILLQLRQSVINPLQAYGRSPEEQTSTGIAKIRFFRRHQVGLPVRVHDASNPEIWGYIRDVSERGLGIQGIEAAIDEIKTLVIFSNEFFSINQISLVAKCRWVTPTGDTRKCLTGFETIRISDSSFERLKRFIEACARAEQASKAPARSESSRSPASAKAKTETVWVCPFCQKPQNREYEECPQCGIIAKKYMQRLDKTKTEILDMMEKEAAPDATAASRKEEAGSKTIAISAKLWSDLESLGGDPYEHLINALSTYVLRHRVSRYRL